MANATNETLSRANGPVSDIKTIGRSVENFFDKVSHEAVVSGGEITSNVSKSTLGYLKRAREYVKENPVTAVGIATVFGMVCGGILSMVLSHRE